MTTKSSLKLYLDPYDREVRLRPGLFVLFPVSLLIGVVGLQRFAPISIAIGFLAAAGGPALLADTVREYGLQAQERLYKRWGGMSTTAALRTRGQNDSVPRRDKWRNAVATVTGQQLPSARSEARSPAAADQQIESVVDDLRDRLRDHERFPLLWRELRVYGRRRNLYGVRVLGIAVALVCSVVLGVLLLTTAVVPVSVGVAVILINLLEVGFWCLVVREPWVKRAANRYAFQLFQATVAEASDLGTEVAK